MKTKSILSKLRLFMAPALLAAGPLHAEPPGSVEKSDEAMAAWLETSLLLSREKADWKALRATLEDRIALMESELAGLRQRTETAREEGARTAEEINTLEQEKDSLLRVSNQLAQDVAALEASLRAFLVKAPGPIRERVRPLSQRLPADSANATASTSERFQNVVGILNEMGKFGREISLASEIRDAGDGVQVEVTTMYLGFGQAYYVNPERGIAGVGRPGTDGWVWNMQPDIAAAVQQAIAIYRNELPAAYVRLPLEVRTSITDEVQP